MNTIKDFLAMLANPKSFSEMMYLKYLHPVPSSDHDCFQILKNGQGSFSVYSYNEGTIVFEIKVAYNLFDETKGKFIRIINQLHEGQYVYVDVAVDEWFSIDEAFKKFWNEYKEDLSNPDINDWAQKIKLMCEELPKELDEAISLYKAATNLLRY